MNGQKRTQEEQAAVEKDIENGLQQIATFMANCITNLPTALNELHFHATSTKQLFASYGKMLEATQEMKRALQLGIKVKGGSK